MTTYYQKGDIAIRVDNKHAQSREIGEFLICTAGNDYAFSYDGGVAFSKAIRLATHEEIQAYNKGCRHIRDLHKYLTPLDLLLSNLII